MQKHHNLRFLIIGDGLLRPQLEAQIEQAGLAPFFHFTGLVKPVEIPGLIGAMDLLVHTSLREGLARALPQALLAGKPVISYDVDGAREVVITNETGTTKAATANGAHRSSCACRGASQRRNRRAAPARDL